MYRIVPYRAACRTAYSTFGKVCDSSLNRPQSIVKVTVAEVGFHLISIWAANQYRILRMTQHVLQMISSSPSIIGNPIEFDQQSAIPR